MNKQLPTREQAIQLLHETNCSLQVIAHCEGVAKLARETAEVAFEKGFKVDVELVEIGALLHDIGRSQTHSVDHAIAGAKIAAEKGLPEEVAAIIKRHVGGGITKEEARDLGWPEDEYMPVTLEEKIVSYADKLVETFERVPIEDTIDRLRKEKMFDAAERVIRLNREITNIIGA
ncbi:MAG: HD domain-containing protein [Crenarchaeota archaeon]|nr:HD domain-containing protein [Thermoproteota archaeon]